MTATPDFTTARHRMVEEQLERRGLRDPRVLAAMRAVPRAAFVPPEMADEVFTVERHARLAEEAEERLRRLGYGHVHVRCADGSMGWPEHAPYDAVVVAAGAPAVPETLKEQLAVGGRLVIPVGRGLTLQDLLRLRRLSETEYAREELGGVRFVPLVGEEGWDW